MKAYSEAYLVDTMDNLATAFDYAINDLKIKPNKFINDFVYSNEANLFEDGAPQIITGMSGFELVHHLYNINPKVKQKIKLHQSREYWLGYYLAYYQWCTCTRFKDVFSRIGYETLINLYSVYHEMDVTKFVEEIDRRMRQKATSSLKRLRSINQLSQNELAVKSGVNKHMIQLYEQGVNDLNKAQVNTLYRLAKALNCRIEDLLVNPL